MNNNMMNENAIKEKYLRGNKAKLNMAKIAAVAMVVTALILSFIFFGTAEKRDWVYDKDEVLSESAIDIINKKNAALYEATGEKAEIVVVVEKNSDKNLPKTAEKLFKEYKVSGDGMLFVVSIPKNAVTAPTTSVNAVEEWAENIAESIGGFLGGLFGGDSLPYACVMGKNIDFSLSNANTINGIFTDNFYESYEKGDYNAAILSTFDAFYDEFKNLYDTSGYDFELSENEKEPEDAPAPMTILAWIIIPVIILFAAEVLFRALFGKKNAGATRVYKNSSWFSGAKK